MTRMNIADWNRGRPHSPEHRAAISAGLRRNPPSPERRAEMGAVASARLLARRASTFWPKVDKSSDCWIWSGRKDSRGYGLARYGREQLAHRVAYVLANGPIPNALTLDHLCRNPSCVRPDHLEAVTLAENIRRAVVARSRRTV